MKPPTNSKPSERHTLTRNSLHPDLLPCHDPGHPRPEGSLVQHPVLDVGNLSENLIHERHKFTALIVSRERNYDDLILKRIEVYLATQIKFKYLKGFFVHVHLG